MTRSLPTTGIVFCLVFYARNTTPVVPIGWLLLLVNCNEIIYSNERFQIFICCVFREEILTNAKALVEDTKALVPAAQASQDVLANAAQSAVTSINKLSDCVKLGAAALGADDTNAQV